MHVHRSNMAFLMPRLEEVADAILASVPLEDILCGPHRSIKGDDSVWHHPYSYERKRYQPVCVQWSDREVWSLEQFNVL